MNTPTRLLVGLVILASWSAARADDSDSPTTQPAFAGSPAAQQAAAKYETAMQTATRKYEADMEDARKKYLIILKRELNEQTRKHNTDLAADLSNRIQQLEADSAAYKKKLADAALAAAAFKETSIGLGVGGKVKMEFILLPAGTFIMGSKNVKDAPPHQVRISRPFFMGKYSVTQEQWQAVMGTNPSYFQAPKNPTLNINWNDCQNFIAKINQTLTGQKVALPTEAQWEYACRAGTQTEFYFGDDEASLGDYAWYAANDGKQTHQVGTKKPNAWGLYDMHGNAWNWCADWYGPYSGPAVDPTGPASGHDRVLRGGSWYDGASFLRSANRIFCAPDYNHDLGAYDCRLVMENLQ